MPTPMSMSKSRPDAPACIYYTSGSTGPAKGVVDCHRNVMHNVARYTHALHIGEQDRLTLLQSCGFSGAVSNIFGALLNGAALLPFDVRRYGVAALARWLAAAEPTIYHSVPSLFRQLVDTGVALPTLRVIRIEGDLGGAPDVERFQRHFNRPGQARCVLAHGLGTTETGLVAQHVVTAGMPPPAGAMPVGHALPDVQIEIVDSTGHALPAGQIGEIAITGRYLATGYWQRPDLTAARFTPAADGQRCYRCGDLGRMDPNGGLEVHGRADLLVRIHGEWIDLHGLEQALRAHAGVRDAIVTSFEAPGGAPALRAHVIADAADENGWHDTLRRALPTLAQTAHRHAARGALAAGRQRQGGSPCSGRAGRRDGRAWRPTPRRRPRPLNASWPRCLRRRWASSAWAAATTSSSSAATRWARWTPAWHCSSAWATGWRWAPSSMTPACAAWPACWMAPCRPATWCCCSLPATPRRWCASTAMQATCSACARWRAGSAPIARCTDCR